MLSKLFSKTGNLQFKIANCTFTFVACIFFVLYLYFFSNLLSCENQNVDKKWLKNWYLSKAAVRTLNFVNNRNNATYC